MPLTEVSCGVLYLGLIPSIESAYADILKIEARLEGQRFAAWITPSKKLAISSQAVRYGLGSEDGNFILENQIHPTRSLKSALDGFLDFIWKIEKSILLVTHSSGFEFRVFFRALNKTNMVESFGRVIEGVLDTQTTFAAQIPFVLQGQYRGAFFNTSERLEILETLVSKSIPTSVLIQKSEPYEKVVSRLLSLEMSAIRQNRSEYVRNFNNSNPLRDIVNHSILNKLKTAGLSYSTLKKLSQRMNLMEFYKYIEERMREVTSSNLHPFVVFKIADFFTKGKAHQYKNVGEAGQPYDYSFTRRY